MSIKKHNIENVSFPFFEDALRDGAALVQIKGRQTIVVLTGDAAAEFISDDELFEKISDKVISENILALKELAK